MTIIRDGKEIVLTDEELYSAWHEKQEQYYTEDITQEVNDILGDMDPGECEDTYGCTPEQMRDMIPEIVYKYWDYCDSNDAISELMYDNRQYAISHVIKERCMKC